jgi:hypothetical protein
MVIRDHPQVVGLAAVSQDMVPAVDQVVLLSMARYMRLVLLAPVLLLLRPLGELLLLQDQDYFQEPAMCIPILLLDFLPLPAHCR